MNLKKDFSIEKQNLLQQANVKVEDKNYSASEIKEALNNVYSYIMNQSCKSGALERELKNYSEILNQLIDNEK